MLFWFPGRYKPPPMSKYSSKVSGKTDTGSTQYMVARPGEGSWMSNFEKSNVGGSSGVPIGSGRLGSFRSLRSPFLPPSRQQSFTPWTSFASQLVPQRFGGPWPVFSPIRSDLRVSR